MYLSALIGLYPTWSEIAMFSALGFGVVMVVLSVLSIVTSIVGQGFIAVDKAKKAPKSPSVQKVKDVSEIKNPDHAFVVSAAVASVLPELEADNGELIAVLSAAASVVLGEECQVISVKSAPDMAYAYQGRQQIYASKNYVPTRVR
jgi:Na+-transporting methylmalonyl-CoA/oxaloacetate decarboxylase gamma subunit